MKISYAITVCREFKEIESLISFLIPLIDKEDEIAVLLDSENCIYEVEQILENFAFAIQRYEHPLNKDFAAHKNHLKEKCSGDYIFQIDVDEMPNEYLIKNIKKILTLNPTVEVFRVPRINIVENMTEEDIQRYRWRISERNGQKIINFPDWQQRIWKNITNIKWKNKVHEVLCGYKIISDLPINDKYCLLHIKTIERQRQQNEFYGKI